MMTAKEYLRRGYRLNEKIKSKLEDIAELKSLSYSISGMRYDKDKVQKSITPADDKLCKTIDKIIKYEKQTNEMIDKYVGIKTEINEIIKKVQNINAQCVLQNRYVNFYTWEKIAEELNFTVQWVHVLHSRGLEEVDNLLL